MCFALAACTGITTTTPDGRETTRSREEFERYVEAVFRRQNQASVEAGQLLNEEIKPGDRIALEAAERNMLRACSALNQVVKQKMERENPGIFLEMEVRDTIGACDFTTRMLEELIAEQE
ncbi:MAG: hypothetical protein L0Y43_10245 [Methylococcaceae bacterium]|nr:hypothetical protein [Methylococcaceae bacterium]